MDANRWLEEVAKSENEYLDRLGYHYGDSPEDCIIAREERIERRRRQVGLGLSLKRNQAILEKLRSLSPGKSSP